MDTSPDVRTKGEAAVRDTVTGVRDTVTGAVEGYGPLITDVIKDLQDLLRAEVQLAKTEIKEDVTGVGKAIALIAGGAFVGLVAFIFLMLALTYLLDQWVQGWVAAAIVGLGLAVIAAIAALAGKKRLSVASLKPEQTIETLKEDQEWAKQQINSAKK